MDTETPAPSNPGGENPQSGPPVSPIYPSQAGPDVEKLSVLPDNVAATLAYLVVPAVAWLFMEPYKYKENLRFHAWQAIFLWGVSLTCYFAFWLVTSISVMFLEPMWLLLRVVNLASAGLAIYCMVKAYNKESFAIPLLGGLARQQAKN